MRIANVDGRLKLLVADGAVDVETASGGRFGPDPQVAYERFDELRHWAGNIDQAEEPFSPESAGPPAPSPRQVFAIGLNYRDHAAESGFQAPAFRRVHEIPELVRRRDLPRWRFPKARVDWEVEVVAVIGKTARDVPMARGWDYVAGLTAGQDLSERDPAAKRPGPSVWVGQVVSWVFPDGSGFGQLDEIDRPDDLGLGCSVNGEEMQKGRTSDMIFPIPELVVVPVGDRHALSRRHHLYRHTAGRRDGTHSAAVLE